jgi:arsenate reductase
MIVYVYEKCSTCKAALLFLKEHRVAFTEKEICIEPPSISELHQMLSYENGNLKRLFNTSGLLYKEMQLKEKLPDMSFDEAFALLNQHGMLVKRPFLLGDNFGLLGFKEMEWSKKILNHQKN